MHTDADMHARLHATNPFCVSLSVCRHACVHVHMHVRMHECVRVCMHAYMYACKHVQYIPVTRNYPPITYLPIYLPT